MLERLKRFREPAAYLVLAAVGLQIVLALVAVGYYTVMAGPSGAGYIAAQQLSRTLLLVATIVVAGCALWGRPTPHARAIVLAGIALFGVHGGLALVLAVVGMFESGNAFAMVAVLLELLVPGLAIVVLAQLRSALPPPRPVQGPLRQGPRQQAPVQQAPVQQFPPDGRPGLSADRPSGRSQTDQFGNPHANSVDRYGANSGSRRPGAVEPDQWQPVQQSGPQRLEPSPYRPPVGPHTRSDGTDEVANGGPDQWRPEP